MKININKKEFALDQELIQQLKSENRSLVIELKKVRNELAFQNSEKVKRGIELGVAHEELIFQNLAKEKQDILNEELEKLRKSARLASQYSLCLIEANRDPLFTISLKGKITDLNQATVRFTGIPREKLIGTDFFNYFTEPEKARKGYQLVFSKGFISDYPLTFTDEKKTNVLFNGSVYKDDRNKVLGAVVVASDITGQKRISTELNEELV